MAMLVITRGLTSIFLWVFPWFSHEKTSIFLWFSKENASDIFPRHLGSSHIAPGEELVDQTAPPPEKLRVAMGFLNGTLGTTNGPFLIINMYIYNLQYMYIYIYIIIIIIIVIIIITIIIIIFRYN